LDQRWQLQVVAVTQEDFKHILAIVGTLALAAGAIVILLTM
jgi:hypothetical protein